MAELTEEQKRRATEAMRVYLDHPVGRGGMTPAEDSAPLDVRRQAVIEGELGPLLAAYLSGEAPLLEFKPALDGLNKRHELWGFQGIKGQMFFNMAYNVAADPAELDTELRAGIALPPNEDIARNRLTAFINYIGRIGEQHVEAGGSKHSRPKVSSVPYFVSYFWHIQDRETWPIYYTNAVNTMADLDLWQPSDDPAESYIRFKQTYEELAALFGKTAGRPFSYYDVEHVFCFKERKAFREEDSAAQEQPTVGPEVVEPERDANRLPDSYVPPIVAVLPRMARNDPALVEDARASGTTLDRAFERGINAAFTVLGYETRLLGQGQGRVPDGLAVEMDNSYAIIWDAKMRADVYRIGTDDRAIREYVATQSRELKRRKMLRNIYYAIISNGFRDDHDDSIRMLKMETDVSEVCLLEAETLVAMVDLKLRDPLQITLGPDGLQRLFSTSGLLTGDDVRAMLE